MKQQILICHGLNTRSPYYSQHLIDNLKPLLADVDYEITPIYIGDTLEKNLDGWEEKQKKALSFNRLKAHDARLWMGTFVGDMYQFENSYEDLLSQALKVVHPLETVHLVAHSWGCVFAAEHLIPKLKPVSVTLHGSPLDLYRLKIKDSSILYSFGADSETDNFFHPMDFIGGPMEHCSMDVLDHVISDAGPGFDILDSIESFALVHDSHGAGWQSKAMARCIATKVRAAASNQKNDVQKKP